MSTSLTAHGWGLTPRGQHGEYWNVDGAKCAQGGLPLARSRGGSVGRAGGVVGVDAVGGCGVTQARPSQGPFLAARQHLSQPVTTIPHRLIRRDHAETRSWQYMYIPLRNPTQNCPGVSRRFLRLALDRVIGEGQRRATREVSEGARSGPAPSHATLMDDLGSGMT